MSAVDQVPDRASVGIPADVDLARVEVRRNAEIASAAARSATESEAAAQDYALQSQDWAEQSRDWAESNRLRFHFGPDEPELAEKDFAYTWFRTDEAAGLILQFLRWDYDKPGNGAFPSNDTYPGDDLYPADRGAWTPFDIDSSLIRQGEDDDIHA